MLELKKKHKRGKRTFIYSLFSYGWWLTLIGIILFYLTWSIYYGPLHDSTDTFLHSHQDWYISIPMLSEWLLLLGFSFLLIAYLRARVMYSRYKFILDPHAFHLHKGIFFIRETTIPYDQISNVHINRPYHYRLFGIAQLDIVTSSDNRSVEDDGRQFLFPMIDTSVARLLSRQLLENASRTKSADRRSQSRSEDDLDDEDDYEDADEEGDNE
jgi:uncharacterized membrane protein YdbT with pleckstrin-like domain